MATFAPVNNLELKLRAVLADKNTPPGDFYPRLAASPVWLIVRRHPELDGTGLVVPPGKNPEICVMRGPKESFIGIYTEACRAKEAMTTLKVPARDWTVGSAPGFRLLRFLDAFDGSFIVNAGLPKCQLVLEPDLLKTLLSQPEPEPEVPKITKVNFHPPGHPEKFLGPLREFLVKQPKVRAAWIVGQTPKQPLPAGGQAYDIGLLMDDVDDAKDDRLLHAVSAMAKALGPAEMEWTASVLMADEASVRTLAKKTRPFYARADFLKS